MSFVEPWHLSTRAPLFSATLLILVSACGGGTDGASADNSVPATIAPVAMDRQPAVPERSHVATSDTAVSSATNVAVLTSPLLPPLPDITNSAESLQTYVDLPLRDGNGATLSFLVSSSAPDVATATVDAGTRRLMITPLKYGTTQIEVLASNGVAQDAATFGFSVQNVTKTRVLRDAANAQRAIRISNTGSQTVELALQHNDSRLESSIEGMLQSVRELPDEFEGEPIERKLWRHLRDNVYHDWSLSYEKFTKDPLLLVNSLGWGLCGDVSIAYMHLARAAGLQSRVWYLEGHVVPEVRHVNAKWSVYDPDLALYYTHTDGSVAGVAELASNPTLITNPISTLFRDPQWFVGNSSYVADIYATTHDNALADDLVPYLVEPQEYRSGLLKLPAGAVLSYPGRWTGATGQVDYDHARTPVAAYANMKLELPANFSGVIDLPLQLAHVSGSGRVKLNEVEFEIVSADLASQLGNPRTAASTLEVMESTSAVTLYFFINPLRFFRQSHDSLQLTGKDVWALEVTEESLTPEATLDVSVLSTVRKPTSGTT